MKHNDTYTFYNEHPKQCASDDFWGQVRRTVNGEPVPQEQIDLIINNIGKLLCLNPEDRFLDLCCGNGALTTSFFAQCSGGLGVDFSSFLIDVAKDNFIRHSGEEFLCTDVIEFIENEKKPERFSKSLCYGSFQFIADDSAQNILANIRKLFPNIQILILGNMPDRSRFKNFFGLDRDPPNGLDDKDSAIGVWRSADQITEMGNRAGWSVEFHQMPKNYHASHYRFDAILRPV